MPIDVAAINSCVGGTAHASVLSSGGVVHRHGRDPPQGYGAVLNLAAQRRQYR